MVEMSEQNDIAVELHVGDEHRTVSAGAFAILPRGIPHGLRNVASRPSRLLFTIGECSTTELFGDYASRRFSSRSLTKLRGSDWVNRR